MTSRDEVIPSGVLVQCMEKLIDASEKGDSSNCDSEVEKNSEQTTSGCCRITKMRYLSESHLQGFSKYKVRVEEL